MRYNAEREGYIGPSELRFRLAVFMALAIVLSLTRSGGETAPQPEARTASQSEASEAMRGMLPGIPPIGTGLARFFTTGAQS